MATLSVPRSRVVCQSVPRADEPENLSARWRRLCDEGNRQAAAMGLTEEDVGREIAEYYSERRGRGGKCE